MKHTQLHSAFPLLCMACSGGLPPQKTRKETVEAPVAGFALVDLYFPCLTERLDIGLGTD